MEKPLSNPLCTQAIRSNKKAVKENKITQKKTTFVSKSSLYIKIFQKGPLFRNKDQLCNLTKQNKNHLITIQSPKKKKKKKQNKKKPCLKLSTEETSTTFFPTKSNTKTVISQNKYWKEKEHHKS